METEDRMVGLDIVALISGLNAQQNRVVESLTDGLMREVNGMRDTIQTVLENFYRLTAQPYAPSTNAIIQAMSPLYAYDTDHRYGAREGD